LQEQNSHSLTADFFIQIVSIKMQGNPIIAQPVSPQGASGAHYVPISIAVPAFSSIQPVKGGPRFDFFVPIVN
jgi:hypothetical protein